MLRIALGITLGVLASARLQSQQPAVTGLTYTPPAGWIRQDDPRGLATLMPTGLPRGVVCTVNIVPAQRFAGNAEELHVTLMRLATQNARLLDVPQRGIAGSFLTSTFRQVTPQGVVLLTTLYTARWEDRGQAVVFASNNPNAVRAYLPVVTSMVASVQVPASVASVPGATSPSQPAPAAPRANDDFAYHPKAVPPADRAVPVVGSYISAAARSSYSVGSGIQSKVQTLMLVLYRNGLAARSLVQKDGSVDANYEAEGFATVDANNPSSLGVRERGQWTEQSGKVSIAWANGEKVDLTRDGANLKEQYVTWTPYASVDGLRLDGRFQRVPPFGPPWQVTLRKDGTFAEDLAGETMGGTLVNPAFPEHGSGTYEIRRWSLVLHFGNGFVQSINLMLGQGGPASTSMLVLNGFDFMRTAGR
jgi:hypothetical protein